MSLTIAGVDFAHAHYDTRGDVLYLTADSYRWPAAGAHVSDEGHGVEFDEAGRPVAMTIVGARWYLERDGELTITFAEGDLRPRELAAISSPTVRASAAELAPALPPVA
jgi:uncharacterized protein YuzE